tara:strand:- start:5345 stop:5497 length:153 start_codon:yes stop_codon:yes gene_type:complete
MSYSNDMRRLVLRDMRERLEREAREAEAAMDDSHWERLGESQMEMSLLGE